jgi:integrase/recombinase XerD
MADIKLDYVNSFDDARGKLRHTFRRKGHKKVTIKGRLGSPDFMDAYHALLGKTGGAKPVADIGASRTKAGTIDALIANYKKHDDFTTALSKAKQDMRRPILDHFRDFKTPSGRRYGNNRLAGLQEKDIRASLEGRKPNAQRNWIKVIRRLIAFGKLQGECSIDLSAGIKPTRGPKSMGHMTWKLPQIGKYREHHKVGTMARLALELMLNIAAHGGDAHKIGRPHLSFDPDNQLSVLTWRPGKTLRTTGKSLTIPVLPSLQVALDAMPKTDVLTFLATDYRKPFKSAAAFGNKFADWYVAAGLQPVECDDGRTRSFRAHGLRKAALIGRNRSAVAGAGRARQHRGVAEVHSGDRTGRTGSVRHGAGSRFASQKENRQRLTDFKSVTNSRPRD